MFEPALIYGAQARYEDLLREAEAERLLRRAGPAIPRRGNVGSRLPSRATGASPRANLSPSWRWSPPVSCDARLTVSQPLSQLPCPQPSGVFPEQVQGSAAPTRRSRRVARSEPRA